MFYKSIYIGEIDMISIYKIGSVPPQLTHCSIGFYSGPRRLRMNYIMFTIRLIPNRSNIYSLRCCFHYCSELRFSLMVKTIPYSKAELSQFHTCIFFSYFPKEFLFPCTNTKLKIYFVPTKYSRDLLSHVNNLKAIALN